MFWHVLCALVLLCYLEISGQYILYRLGKNDYPLSFPIGLMALMAYCYVSTSILTNNDCSFKLIAFIYSLYILVSLIFIIKDIKKVNWHFDYKNWLIAFVFVGVMVYYAWNTKLGDLSGFDTIYYLNLISTNAGIDRLNSINLFYGGPGRSAIKIYSFQSYFYFVSYFIWIAYKLLVRVTEVTNISLIIWVFQIIYNFFLVSILINCLDKYGKKKKLLKFVILFIFLFYFGKIYFNNVFGFYGNTYRTISIAYSVMYLYELSKETNIKNWLLFGISLISACAFSSTATFEAVLILFISYFILIDKEDNLFRYYALLIYIPLLNAIVVGYSANTTIGEAWWKLLILCIALFILNKPLVKITRNKYVKVAVVLILFAAMFYKSYTVTGNIFDFSAFFENSSEKYDMTLNYFNLYDEVLSNKNVYKVMVLVLLAYSFIFEHKNPLVFSFIILVVVLFNPFCCGYINKINSVYYRAYEIIINPFTIILFSNMLLERINNKNINYCLLLLVFVLFAIKVDYLTPSYYHSTFEPSEDYNNLMKMDKGEYDVIRALKEDVDYNIDTNPSPYIINSNILTESIITNGRYLYGREYKVDDGWSEGEKQLYSMIYPPDYKGEKNIITKIDYDNIAEYIKEAGVSYIVINRTLDYYDEDLGYYNFLVYKIAECGYGYSIYHNDTYELLKYD